MSVPPALGNATGSVLGTSVFPLSVADEPEVVLVSDLHLRPETREDNAAFHEFIASVPDGGLLVVLGDLFDFWVGTKQLHDDSWRSVTECLRVASLRGVRIYTLWGNRDFQLNAGFERAIGCRVVPGALLLQGGARPLLCLHGDELCQNDRAYQKAKRRLRSRPVRALLDIAPFFVSRRLAEQARTVSKKTVAAALPSSLHPSVDAMAKIRALGEVDTLFGHIHLAAAGALPGDGPTLRYWVLPAFEADSRGHVRLVPGGEPRLFECGDQRSWPGPPPLGP
jgi:UDP-2,3-diacylglucosamine hydrolase